jgi:hypothetical protein
VEGGLVVVVVVGEVVVVVVGDVVVVVVGEVVVVVVGVVVLEVDGPGVSTKYAAIPAMTRITTMTMTAEVVLMAPRLLIFILGFTSSLEIIKALAAS